MFVRMLKLPEAQRCRTTCRRLKCAIHAAAPCPMPVKQQMIEWWGPIIWEYYAGTEGKGMTLVDSAAWLAHKGTVGRAVVGALKICDDDGEELPVGEIGTVYFADGKAFEYHNDPEKTAASRNAKGWSTLGDIGHVDTEGYLYLTDRKAHMIISGGVNIYPQEGENLLVTHPKVLDVAVFGVPERGVRRRGQGGGAAARHGRSRQGAGTGADRLLPRAAVGRSSARARSTSKRNCRAIRPASCTSGCCAIATGRGEAAS